MSKIQRILLAFDFNTLTNPAVEKARYLAERFDAELILVHAVEYVPYHPGLNYWNVIHDEVKPKMDGICKSLSGKGIKVHAPVIKEGRPYNVILSLTAQVDADLIVIGTGKAGVADSLLGTTAVKVIRNALQPVYVVHPRKSQLEIRKILCAVDLSIASNQVLIAAKNLSVTTGAELFILHVVPKSKKYPGLEQFETPVVDVGFNSKTKENIEQTKNAIDEQIQASSAKIFDDYVKKTMGNEKSYNQVLRQGLPDVEISNEVNSKDYDLLVMGTIDQSGFSRILVGNITEKVMRKISCSLLTLRYRDMPTALSTPDHFQATGTNEGPEEKFARLEKHYQKGKELLAGKEAKKAIEEFRLCLEMDQHFYGAYEALGDCYRYLKDSEKSTLHYNKARNQRRYVWELQKD